VALDSNKSDPPSELQCNHLQVFELEDSFLKRQLDDTSAKLVSLESQLNETNAKLAELQAKNAQLEQQIQNQTAQIEKLRQELKIKNCDWARLAMELEWDPVHVYFFLYQVSAQSFIPSHADICDLDQWNGRAKALYPGPYIPIAESCLAVMKPVSI